MSAGDIIKRGYKAGKKVASDIYQKRERKKKIPSDIEDTLIGAGISIAEVDDLLGWVKMDQVINYVESQGAANYNRSIGEVAKAIVTAQQLGFNKRQIKKQIGSTYRSMFRRSSENTGMTIQEIRKQRSEYQQLAPAVSASANQQLRSAFQEVLDAGSDLEMIRQRRKRMPQDEYEKKKKEAQERLEKAEADFESLVE